MDRQEALDLLRKYVTTDNLRKHCLATEAVMRALAQRLGEPVELWGIVGLLHDLDYEQTSERPEEHGMRTAAMLADTELPAAAITTIKAHNAEVLGVERSSVADFALTCAESITGLVVATALVYPDKRLASVKSKSILKRMKQKDFARRVSRDHIRLCEKIGVPLADFADLSLRAMQGISQELGL
ncbi:MAG: HDIG domain-containing protein [Deltaproteobacteria bacterium]|nr:MAG: HDIG domain-containing protein [Deltaproteobacteria bacterium]